MKRLFLIDAYALIFRFYYAFLNRPMRNREGLNTSAIFGFTKFLNDIIRNERPDLLGVAFDPGGKTFRTELYPLYKANRDETPEDIRASVPYIKQILSAMGIPILQVAGYEADDVIGTLSVKGAEAGYEVYMVTPDKDYGQLVQPNVRIYKQRKGADEIEIIGMSEIAKHYGVEDPKLIVDILALWGDASDNIPGVPGIGEKSAIKLVSQFGTVEQILSDTSKLKGKQRENIEACREQLPMSKRLAEIDLNVPIEFDAESLKVKCPDCAKLTEIYKYLNFNMFLRELDSMCSTLESVSNGECVQRDLFGAVVQDKRDVPAVEPVITQGSLFGEDAPSVYKDINSTPHKYTIVADNLQFEAMLIDVERYDLMCIDTETTGLDPYTARLIGISLAVREHEAYYIVLPTDDEQTFGYRLGKLKPLLENPNIKKVGQNLKFDYMVLRTNGITLNGLFLDTMVMHYLINPESRHGMDFLAKTYLNYSPIPIEELIGRGTKQLTMDMVAKEKVANYAAEDADVTLLLYKVLWAELEKLGLTKLYLEIEAPLIRVLGDIELNGVRLDTQVLSSYAEELDDRIDLLESEIRMMADMPSLNINSSKQLGEVLFEKLQLDPKPKRTKTKQYSTDEEYLQSLSSRHPIIEKVLEYRGLRKLMNTYVTALPQMVNPVTGRIHTSFNQTVTATGRLSSTDPNLQNIPIRDDDGREIRRAFVPTDDDHILVAVDYSQVELRIMASLSGDEELINAFVEEKDIHTATAAKIFHIADEEVTREQRRRAKTANFGIIYGISVFGLSQRLSIPRAEAKQLIDGYFTTYPAVREYMEKSISDAKQLGYVTTLFGRRRLLPDINSGNAVVRGLAERNAVNAPIQGSAADIMKIAMVRVAEQFAKEDLKSKIILQVHDELVVDALKEEQAKVVEILKTEMENAARLSVPLTVEVGMGASWLDAH